MITNNDLYKACKKNEYLQLAWKDGSFSVLNCKIGLFKKYERFCRDEIDTQIVGLWPISFSEYISRKTPFITS